MSFRFAGLLFALALACSRALAAETRDIVDMAGRRVAIPAHPARIYGAAPPVTLTLYALAPELLIGLNVPFRGDEKPLLRKEAAELPAIGSQAGMGRELNLEEVASRRPDLVIAWLGHFMEIDKAERSFARIGAPVIFLKLDTLEDYSKAFVFLGEILGREQKASEFARYIDDALARVREATASIPPEQRIRVYYAETADGLATDCDKGFHAEAIALAAGDNVYHCTQSTHLGQDRIGLEQIVALRPQIIVAQHKGFGEMAKTHSQWRNVEAVKQGRIVFVPHAPFNWIDRPPSYMRALGVQWLAHLFYPERYPLDLVAETKSFYRLFLGVEPSDADVARILE
jgi:iron complex transport system substrate-binding protein